MKYSLFLLSLFLSAPCIQSARQQEKKNGIVFFIGLLEEEKDEEFSLVGKEKKLSSFFSGLEKVERKTYWDRVMLTSETIADFSENITNRKIFDCEHIDGKHVYF